MFCWKYSHEEMLSSPAGWKSHLILGEPADHAALRRVPAAPESPSLDQAITAHLRHLSLQVPARRNVPHQSCDSLVDPSQLPQALTFLDGPEGRCRQEEDDSHQCHRSDCGGLLVVGVWGQIGGVGTESLGLMECS